MTRYEKKMDHRDTETQRKRIFSSLRPLGTLRVLCGKKKDNRGGRRAPRRYAESLFNSFSLCLCVSVVHLSLVQFMGEEAALENGRP